MDLTVGGLDALGEEAVSSCVERGCDLAGLGFLILENIDNALNGRQAARSLGEIFLMGTGIGKRQVLGARRQPCAPAIVIPQLWLSIL